MRRYNFSNANGAQLGRDLSSGADVPVNIPTSRGDGYHVGEELVFTRGDRLAPTHITNVVVLAARQWTTMEGKKTQNLIVKQAA